MPDARCTRGLVCGLHKGKCTRAYRAAEAIRHSLRDGFTAYAVLSPETSSWLTPSLPVQLTPIRRLDASNGRQDRTLLSRYVFATSASTATRPTSVTTADAL